MRKMALAIAALLAIAVVPSVGSARPNGEIRSLGPDVRELDPKAHHQLSRSSIQSIRAETARLQSRRADDVHDRAAFYARSVAKPVSLGTDQMHAH